MNEQQLTLTRLLGKKELTIGCVIIASSGLQETIDGFYKLDRDKRILYTQRFCHGCPEEEAMPIREIIGHPATLSGLHRWMNENFDSSDVWKHLPKRIIFWEDREPIDYDSDKDLIDQTPETLARIIELITNNKLSGE